MVDLALEEFKPKILVVDDEKRIREGCRLMLTQDGYEVDMSEDGSEALEKIKDEHFDIVLLDLMMPGLTGFNVLDEVKALHPDTVIIVITGYATLEHSIEVMKKGAFDFITKPFAPNDLRLVITKALEHISRLKDIAEEKSRTHLLINYLREGILATDAFENVVLANPAFLSLIGSSATETTGRSFRDLILHQALVDLIMDTLKSGTGEFIENNLEFSLFHPGESEETILSARCVPFQDRIGRILGTVTVLHDITTEKKMAQLKNDFVSMVSHEIKNPMNSVLMQLKVILDGLAGNVTDKQTEILGRASERIKALVSMTSELLDLARIESGLIHQEKELVDMSQLLTDMLALHSASALDKSISLELDLAPDLPCIVANRVNMDEMLSNLITNAIKYTPQGGKVLVSASLASGFLLITVKDNGFGMTEEDLNHIFDRFFRVKNEQTRFITGTGLGLSLVKSIVDAHQGLINVESAPNQGTTFRVSLPLPVR